MTSITPFRPQRVNLYFSWVFVVMKSSGTWTPVIDLSCLNACKVHELSYGDSSVGPECSSTGRLDGVCRPEGCLPLGPYSSRFQTPSLFCDIGGSFSIQGNVLRATSSAPDIHKGNGSRFCFNALERLPNTTLFRQLVYLRIVRTVGFRN